MNDKVDLTELYKEFPWQQGYLLLTTNTARWSKAAREEADAQERCRAFVFFTELDMGRGRVLLREFATVDACSSFVHEHNSKLARTPRFFVGCKVTVAEPSHRLYRYSCVIGSYRANSILGFVAKPLGSWHLGDRIAEEASAVAESNLMRKADFDRISATEDRLQAEYEAANAKFRAL